MGSSKPFRNLDAKRALGAKPKLVISLEDTSTSRCSSIILPIAVSSALKVLLSSACCLIHDSISPRTDVEYFSILCQNHWG